MPSRRGFLAGALASATLPGSGWAALGNPSHLTAARDRSGAYALYGLRTDGGIAFRVPLPERGHAAASHPTVAEAVAFARRPGTFALVLDCADGRVRHRLAAPEGLHFYGHGAFSVDGSLLFTTENDIAAGEGMIGVWDRSAGYQRIDQVPSHGIGPHEILRLPDGSLAVANGGIRTHPDSGRIKLNLDTMRPNLAVLAADGRLRDLAELPAALHQNSLRHISALAADRIACGCQWQGDPYDAPPLLALYDGAGLELVPWSPDLSLRMQGYVGSVAWLAGEEIVLTSPRGGLLVSYNPGTKGVETRTVEDVCGVAATRSGGFATDGLGRLYQLSQGAALQVGHHPVAFDNHLVRIAV